MAVTVESLTATSEHQVLKLEVPSVAIKRQEEAVKAAVIPGSSTCAALPAQ